MASQSTTDTETATPETATPGTESFRVEDGATAEPVSQQPAPTSPEQPSAEPAGTDRSGAPAAPARGAGVGAVALVAAGLGLASLTGTSLGDMMRAREEIVGQISAATGGRVDQVEVLYASPWHTVALVNGVVALLAVIVGGVLTGVLRRRAQATRSWVPAVALGGALLGVLGLLVSGGMYLDLFAAAPQIPSMPGLGG